MVTSPARPGSPWPCVGLQEGKQQISFRSMGDVVVVVCERRCCCCCFCCFWDVVFVVEVVKWVAEMAVCTFVQMETFCLFTFCLLSRSSFVLTRRAVENTKGKQKMGYGPKFWRRLSFVGYFLFTMDTL